MPKAVVSTMLSLRDRTTLGQQIAFVFMCLCLGLVVTVTVTAALIARQQATAQVESDMIGIATGMAQRLDTQMFERYREVDNIASLAPLSGIWTGSPSSIKAVLEQMQSTLPEYAWIGFAGVDGTVLAATGGLLEGASVAERPWFQAGLLAPTVQDVHEAKLLAGLLPPPADGEPFRFVDVAAPVRNQAGETIGVLGAHMSWTWADAVRTAELAILDPRQQTELWVLAGDGRILLGPEYGAQPFSARTLAAIQAGRQSYFTDADAGGHMMGAVVAPGYLGYPGLGWIVVARQPLDIALAPANHLTTTIGLIGAALAALGVLSAALLARRLTRPLKELADNIDRIGREPDTSTIARDHSSRDVTLLSVAIRSLLRRLGTAQTAQESAEHESAVTRQMLAEKTQRLGEDMHALQVLADTDPLTGLLNRRAFRVFGVDAMNFFKRHRRDIGVLVIDIDFFKSVNDTYGHSIGDDVIKSVGELIQLEARTIDKVARFGGEEFVVLMRETETEGPGALAERVRFKIAGQLIDHPAHGAIHVTVSIGATMAADSDRDIEDVIERADRALYEAKAQGRNCVVLADRTEPDRTAA